MSDLSFCLQAAALHDEDSSALSDAIERYVGAGMPMRRAQLAAIADVIADVRGEREQIHAAVREQHPAVKPAAEGNPFRTFLMRQGVALHLAADFAPGTRERLAMGRTFRGNGMELDQLAQRAAEQGFLHSPDDVEGVYQLIARAAAGERVTPLYGRDGEAELAARVEQHRQRQEEDAVAALGALEDNEFSEVVDAIPDLDAPSNTTAEAAMRALGFSDQEIADAIAHESRSAQADSAGGGEAGEAAAGQAPDTRRSGEGQARAEHAAEGLSRPTREDILAQQERAQAGARADEQAKQDAARKASADAQRGDFGLTGSDRSADANPAQRDAFDAAAQGRGPWRSELHDQLSRAKMEASKEEGWRALISGLTQKGVKPDEIEWSGVNDWLKLQQGKVTKQQVLDYLDHNGVQVQEVTHSGLTEESQRDKDFHDRNVRFAEDKLAHAVMEAGGHMENAGGSRIDVANALLALRQDRPGDDSTALEKAYALLQKGAPEGYDINKVNDLRDELESAQRHRDEAMQRMRPVTKYGSYTLPGGENYRELLLTLPVKPKPDAGFADYLKGYRERFPQSQVPDAEVRSFYDRGVSVPPAGKSVASIEPVTYRSGHWDEPNVLAHVRLNDRTDADGKRTLFVEELQSDWAQEGRKKGFDAGGQNMPEMLARAQYERAAPDSPNWRWKLPDGTGGIQPSREAAERAAAESLNQRQRTGIPRAPFVDSTDKWLPLALKRVIKLAVDEGYDRVAFVNGEQSADRYDLSKHVDRIDYSAGEDGGWNLSAIKGGKEVLAKEGISLPEVEELVGKEIAQKMTDGKGNQAPSHGGDYRSLTGLDLKVGGSGMKGFYDKIVPAALNKLLPRLAGERVGSVPIKQKIEDYERTARWVGPERTIGDVEQMLALANKGGPSIHENPLTGAHEMFAINRVAVAGDLRHVLKDMQAGKTFAEAMVHPDVTGSAAELFGGKIERFDAGHDTLQQPGFDITPAMREKAAEGLPMFKRDGSEPMPSGLTMDEARSRIKAMRGASVDQVQKIVEGVTASWKNGPKVDVVASAADLPGNNPRDERGLYTPGRIYIVADAAAHRAGPGQRREIVSTLAHEAVAHYGLRDMLGRQDWTRLMRNIQFGVKAGNRELRRLSDEVRSTYVDADGKFNLHPDQEADEIAARAVENAIDADGNFRPAFAFLKSAWAKVAQFLRDHGFNVGFSNSELQGMLVESMRHLEAGQRTVGRGQLATAAARDEQPMHARGDAAPDEERTAKLADRVGAGYHAYAGVEQVPRASSGTIADSIAKVLIPAGRKDAVLTSGIIRANLGEQAREREVAQQRLMEFAKSFDKMPVADNYKFIDAMERGVPLKDPEQARAAAALRKVLDERRDQVIALGKGNLENFNENYFPHIWKDRTAAANFFTRRPLEGGKGFLKQRTYDFFADGLKAGLEPITTNPVELAMLKAREMDRYIYGQRIFGEMKDAGVAKFVGFGAKAPDGWVKINDKIARVMQYSEAEKGMILRGEYYAPEQAATLINNHLSPGLSGVAAFDIVRKAGNMMNAVQLGLSAFHLGFTTLDAMISKAALGIKQASRGNVIKGAGNVLQALNPAQPFMNLYKGDRLLKAYLGNVNDPELAPIVEALTQAGGRVKMDDVYRNAAANEFRQAVRKGNYGTAAMKVLPRMLDLLNKPIFEYLVPRQKLGVFFDMAKDALEHEPGMDLARKREVMGKLWDSVDNRMGELVYDNVFWNRALKDALQVSVRSVGWNLGTFREIGGGVKDIGSVKKLGGLSDRTSYIFGLTFVTAVIGSLTQYLLTGEGPKELKDVFFPRTGKTRPDGTEDRISLPSYMKDIYEYGHDLRNFAKYGEDPFHTLENKMHPLISTMSQMLTNKDFFGGAIRSPGDSSGVGQLLSGKVPTKASDWQQELDEAQYLLKQMSPFSLRNYQQQAKLKGEEPSIAGYLSSPSMIGITPAPGYITKNDAQAESSQVNKMRESLVTKFREEMRDGADWPEIKQRAMDAGIRGQDLEYIRKSAVQRPPKRLKEFATH